MGSPGPAAHGRGGGAAPAEPPRVVTLVGRRRDRENQDLCGEYHRISVPALVHGRPAYRMPGARTVIRYWPAADRWLVDRDGLREGDSCSAFSEQAGAQHPAREDLLWRVWETPQQAFETDPDLAATAAPPAVQVVSRQPGSAQLGSDGALCGQYRLRAVRGGRAAYVMRGSGCTPGGCSIRFDPKSDRWLLDDHPEFRGADECVAYAEAWGSPSPGTPGLVWYSRDAATGRFAACGLVSMVAPPAVELVGRSMAKENVIMNGTYHLFGLHEGRPGYMKADGSGHAIRYWPKEERWLVDFDGFQDRDVCNAYAEALAGCDHPAAPGTVWHVWESALGRHVADQSVCVASAPHWVRVSGRGAAKENSAINGEYALAAVVEGKAAYRKKGADHVLRYWPSEDRWIIDLESGLLGGDIANAYADAKGADVPGSAVLLWHVWETAQGRHVADPDVYADGVRYGAADWSAILAAAAALGGAPSAREGASACETSGESPLATLAA